MVQAYYTDPRLAFFVGRYLDGQALDRQPLYPRKLLDLGTGAGNLTRGFLHALAKYVSHPELLLVEPGEQPIPTLQQLCEKGRGQVFHMSAEEWALTYAAPDCADLLVCNPPYGERFGRTACNELVTELHFPAMKRFESYFLTIGGAVTSGAMAFLIPDSYCRHPEAATTFTRLAHAGWNLADLRALPIDGYQNALVATSLWFFVRDLHDVKDWVRPAMDVIARQAAPPLFADQERVTQTGLHGPVSGYLMPARKEAVQALDPECAFHVEDRLTPDPNQALDWRPEPKPLGALWQRNGCMYELAESGWKPADSQGFARGTPVSPEFQRARRAYRLMRQGALFTARTMIRGLDLARLREEHRKLHCAGFLHVLRHGPAPADPWTQDLKHLGMLEIRDNADLPPIPDSLERIGPYLVDRRRINLAQLCGLFLKIDEMPDWARDRFRREVHGHQIPLSQLNLRASWLPKSVISEYLGLPLRPDGFFGLPRGPKRPQFRSLAAYLNYGQGPYRIVPGDEEVYQLESQRFALRVNDWDDTAMAPGRWLIHAHYLHAHGPTRAVMAGLGKLQPTRPLHWWQTEDLPFALSGQAILSWDVGLGKTLGGIAAAVAHPGKALIVTPKQVLAKWVRELQQFFPTVRFAVLGFRQVKDRYRLNLKNLVAQAGKVFFDHEVKIILSSHQVFTRLQVAKDDQLAADTADAWDQVGGKPNETGEKARELFVKSAATRNFQFGGELTFTDLPLRDLLLVVDEGHQFKSLFPMPSRGWGDALVMAGQCGKSKRSRDMKIKADLIREAGGKTLCLTATPVSNSVAEIFNMLRIFAPAVLAKRGIRNTQQLVDTYCVLEPITTVSPLGKVKYGQTLQGFQNLADLRAMWAEAMITRTAAEVKLPLPGVTETVFRLQPTPAIRAFMNEQKALLDETVRDEDRKDVCLFEILAAIDAVASYPPLVEIVDNPKGELLARTVARIHRESSGGQLIFSDRLESQAGIKALLVASGIPESEIGIVNASTAPGINDRLKFQDRYNDCTYRVLIGGAVISEGMDLQRHTVAIHFNNLAWEGQTIHQRKGRGVRQGNRNGEVAVYYYLLEGSTDNYRFLTTQNKAHWWEHLRRAQTDAVAENVFSEPVNDELIASLAVHPEEILAILQEKRKAEELDGEIKKFNRLLRRMIEFADPRAREKSLPLLRAHEAKLRSLRWISDAIVDEGIQRVHAIATLQARRIPENRRITWSSWVANVNPIKYSLGGTRLRQCLNLCQDDGEAVFFEPWKTIVNPELLSEIQDMPKTFGAVEPAATATTDAESMVQPLEIVLIEDQPETPRPEVPKPEAPKPVKPVRPKPSADAKPLQDAVQLTFAFLTPAKVINKPAEPAPAPKKAKHQPPPKQIQLSFGF